MSFFPLILFLAVSGFMSAVESSDSGSCDCQHQCVHDKISNSSFIARVNVLRVTRSPYNGTSAYHVVVTKVFPGFPENVKKYRTLVTDDDCPVDLQLKTMYLVAGQVVSYADSKASVMRVTSCDVAVPWKSISKKEQEQLVKGIDPQYCESSPCNTGQICSRTDTESCFTCHCPPGYEGPNCEQDIDDCQPNPCQNGGRCVDGVDSFTCSCDAGFQGDNCEINIDECQSNPCQNGGNCTDGVNSYNCSCATGFDGDNCENYIDECQSNPCQNGGDCTDGVNSYTCSCATGFDGDNCENNIDECQSNPCQNGGNCTDGVNSYTCSCATGFDGDNCENDIDECQSNPCQNGGDCTDGVNSYTCSCATGFDGDNCENNIDECQSNPCQNGGDCTDGVNSYTCSCATGFDGDNCENDIDECQSNPCQNGGDCTDGVNSYTCSCATGFDGDNCENNIDECQSNPCQNGGSCTDGVNAYTCSCATGFDGDNCENSMDACQSNPCQQDGNCTSTDDGASYTCSCATGFSGDNCEDIFCNFDDSLCGYKPVKNSNNYDWTRQTGSVSSFGTGPSQDHTTGHGYYMLTVSTGRKQYDKAILVSPTFEPGTNQKHCLDFWYHMYSYGDSYIAYMGYLNVFLEYQVGGSKQNSKIWQKTRDQGDVWHQARVTISTPGPFTITFESVRGYGYRSNMAIDDVTIMPGECVTVNDN